MSNSLILEKVNARLMFWLCVSLAGAILFLVPGVSFAEAGDPGFFGVEDDVAANTNDSLLSYWNMIRNWLAWGGLIYLCVSIFFWAGKTWWIAIIIWFFAIWGDDMVIYLQTLMGGTP